VKLSKCPYCGTSYFDLSCLQIGDKPFYLKIKDPARGIIFTQKCYLKNVDVSIESHDTYADSPFGCKSFAMCTSRDLTIDLSLEAVAENDKLMTVIKEDT
jgi:hypothetical protein